MKKFVFVLLFSFMLAGCSNSQDKDNVEEVTENTTAQEAVQDETTDENTELTTEEAETTETVSATKEVVEAEEEATEVAVVTEEETTEQPTNEDSDYYAVSTSYSKEDVEMFAQTVKDYILNKNWESLAGTIAYPITVGDTECSNAEDFKKLNFDEIFTDDFYTAIKNESCKEMFCNSGGIMMGNGQVWIAEVLENIDERGELMVIGINP